MPVSHKGLPVKTMEDVYDDLNNVFMVQKALRELGIETVLVGGAPRDIYHGKAPKDYDLVVLDTGNDPTDAAMQELQATTHYQVVRCGLTDEEIDSSISMSDEPHRLNAVWKVPFLDIDIIWTTMSPESFDDVFNDFDFTLNMVGLELATDGDTFNKFNFVFHTELPYMEDGIALRNRDIDKFAMICRRDRMVVKYPEYTYPEQGYFN